MSNRLTEEEKVALQSLKSVKRVLHDYGLQPDGWENATNVHIPSLKMALDKSAAYDNIVNDVVQYQREVHLERKKVERNPIKWR